MGAGCRKVAVGAFPVLRGVKCCCRVVKAGRLGFLGPSDTPSRRPDWVARGCSGRGGGLISRELASDSDLDLMLAERPCPVLWIGAFPLASVASANGPSALTLAFDAPARDLDRSRVTPDFGASLRVAVVLTDCIREWEVVPACCVGREGMPGLRRDCVRRKPLVCGSGSLLTAAGGLIDC